jgi:hypothetical protein
MQIGSLSNLQSLRLRHVPYTASSIEAVLFKLSSLRTLGFDFCSWPDSLGKLSCLARLHKLHLGRVPPSGNMANVLHQDTEEEIAEAYQELYNRAAQVATLQQLTRLRLLPLQAYPAALAQLSQLRSLTIGLGA